MRKLFAASVATIVGACASTPPAPPDPSMVQNAALSVHFSQDCVRKGYVRNQAAMAGAINIAQTTIARAPVMAQQFVNQAKADRPQGFTQEECRLLELTAVRVVQAQQNAQFERMINQQEEAADRYRGQQAMQNMQQSWTQYQPRTMQCQHYQWGNMTTCNAY